jgi:hypothetical protein
MRLVEVSPEEAAPIFKAYLQRKPFARKYATLDPDAPVEDFRAEAHRHPVFRIEDA